MIISADAIAGRRRVRGEVVEHCGKVKKENQRDGFGSVLGLNGSWFVEELLGRR